jgi:ribosomal protein S18 acetylase RimI-like enzyme
MKGLHLRPPHETEFRDIEQIEASWAHVADAGYSAFQAAFHKDWLFLLACDGWKIVGYMCLNLKDGEIFRIAIDDRYKGKGYGAWAMNAACDLFKAMGFKTAYLEVYSENQRAVRLYERLGWYEVTKHGSLIAMRKRLNTKRKGRSDD